MEDAIMFMLGLSTFLILAVVNIAIIAIVIYGIYFGGKELIGLYKEKIK